MACELFKVYNIGCCVTCCAMCSQNLYISFELGQVYQVDNTVGTYTCVHILPPTQHRTLTAACSHFKYVSTLPIYGKNFNSLTKTQQK